MGASSRLPEAPLDRRPSTAVPTMAIQPAVRGRKPRSRPRLARARPMGRRPQAHRREGKKCCECGRQQDGRGRGDEPHAQPHRPGPNTESLSSVPRATAATETKGDRQGYEPRTMDQIRTGERRATPGAPREAGARPAPPASPASPRSPRAEAHQSEPRTPQRQAPGEDPRAKPGSVHTRSSRA